VIDVVLGPESFSLVISSFDTSFVTHATESSLHAISSAPYGVAR
jgi:hypothetical protein